MQKAANQDMAALWNGTSGQAWVDEQPLLDEMFRPFERLLSDEVARLGARSVLDIGCGAGSTTLAAARVLGPAGDAVGIDVSRLLVDAARARADREGARAKFICADAQTHAFSPGTFDAMISRFGVMFFEDPVAAFANLRRAARAGGVLRAVAFRSIAENPFMTAAERAAAPVLPAPPPRQPGAPGQFAFADPEDVRRILDQAGWAGIELAAIDVECAFPESALVRYFTRLGPVAQRLREADEATRTQAIARVLAGFQSYVQGAQVRFTAACWMISADVPGG